MSVSRLHMIAVTAKNISFDGDLTIAVLKQVLVHNCCDVCSDLQIPGRDKANELEVYRSKLLVGLFYRSSSKVDKQTTENQS